MIHRDGIRRVHNSNNHSTYSSEAYFLRPVPASVSVAPFQGELLALHQLAVPNRYLGRENEPATAGMRRVRGVPPATTAPPHPPRRDQIPIACGNAAPKLPAGSFPGGFRTTAPVPAATSRWAVIRNPSQMPTLIEINARSLPVRFLVLKKPELENYRLLFTPTTKNDEDENDED